MLPGSNTADLLCMFTPFAASFTLHAVSFLADRASDKGRCLIMLQPLPPRVAERLVYTKMTVWRHSSKAGSQS